jgi:hypothetical protein
MNTYLIDIISETTYNRTDSIDAWINERWPGMYSILCCMASDASCQTDNVIDFCNEFGYTDGPKQVFMGAETFKAVQIMKGKILSLFTEDELAAFPN